jgi:hypothetical protein
MTSADTAQWITFLTLVLGFLAQIYRENRQRKWDQEDRVEIASRAAQHVSRETAKLGKAIDLNTDISTKAFHEANSVNLKIQAIGVEHNALQRETNNAAAAAAAAAKDTP